MSDDLKDDDEQIEVVIEVMEEKKQEIRDELYDFFSSIKSLKGQQPKIKIIVASDFDTTVNIELSKITDFQYSSKRAEVTAFGKTIPLKDNNSINFVIIFDGKVFGNWDKEELLARIFFYSHEFRHIIEDLQFVKNFGVDYYFNGPTSSEEWMLFLAFDIRSEYYAERCAIEAFQEVVAKESGQVSIDFPKSESNLNSLSNILNGLTPFLKEKVSELTSWKSTINEFFEKVYPRVREMLIIAINTIAYTDTIPEYKEKLETLRDTDAYQKFLGENWTAIHTELISMYEQKEEFNEVGLKKVANELKKIFLNCGVELKTVAGILWVSVKPEML